jgi:hypothetical protein
MYRLMWSLYVSGDLDLRAEASSTAPCTTTQRNCTDSLALVLALTLLQVEARIRLLEGGARLSLSGAKTPSGVKKYDAKVCIYTISTVVVQDAVHTSCSIVCVLHVHTHIEDALLLSKVVL